MLIGNDTLTTSSRYDNTGFLHSLVHGGHLVRLKVNHLIEIPISHEGWSFILNFHIALQHAKRIISMFRLMGWLNLDDIWISDFILTRGCLDSTKHLRTWRCPTSASHTSSTADKWIDIVENIERVRDVPLERCPVRHTSVLSHVDVYITLWTNDIHKDKWKFHYLHSPNSTICFLTQLTAIAYLKMAAFKFKNLSLFSPSSHIKDKRYSQGQVKSIKNKFHNYLFSHTVNSHRISQNDGFWVQDPGLLLTHLSYLPLMTKEVARCGICIYRR